MLKTRAAGRHTGGDRVIRWLAAALAALFAFGAIVQINDPDPGRWFAIYAAASVTSALAAARWTLPAALPAVVGGIALLWGASTALGGPPAAEYARMFDAWEMATEAVEEAREATGLMMIAAWMIVLAVRAVRHGRTIPR